jgi:hypothetical protein
MTPPRPHSGDRAAGLLLAVLAGACDPEFVVGTYDASDGSNAGDAQDSLDGECGPAPDYDPAAEGEALEVPWTTGFENSFCDYSQTGGFCYADPDASFEIVDSFVHGGQYAAAFHVTTDSAQNGWEARCVRQGALPVEATYGAWLYLPGSAESTDNWNLFHFQGGTPDAWHGLWDVSLGSADDGSLFLQLYDFLGGSTLLPDAPMSVPIGSWFHVEFHFLRASDATGEVALYQDGALLLEATGIVTDDSGVAQWYVGNLAKALMPEAFTLYVDDVSIRVGP